MKSPACDVEVDIGQHQYVLLTAVIRLRQLADRDDRRRLRCQIGGAAVFEPSIAISTRP